MKGNDGKAARRQLSQRLLACGGAAFCSLLVFWMIFGGSGDDDLHTGGFDRDYEYNLKKHKRRRKHNDESPSLRKTIKDLASATTHEFHKSLHKEAQRKDHATLIKEVLAAEYSLVDLTVREEELIRAPKNSYDGVYGKFCKLDWRGRKIDPSAVPMFRDLVAASEDCEQNQFTLNLKKVTDLARHQDDESWNEGTVPKLLNFTVATFHESRCGSTLVANAVAAMDPAKHRSYSEAQAPAFAMTSVCGKNFSRCSKNQAAMVLRDVIYLMSRSDDPKEERVFFKFQSATTRTVDIFQMAFPNIPWMFVYRDPTQVMMSHAKDDPELSGRANCLRSKHAPPAEIQEVAKAHGIRDASRMSGQEYCAAHLASITEAAVEALDDIAMPVLYDDLPSILHTTILPKVYGRPMTETEVTNIENISQQYSKGRGHRHKEFTGDSEKKEEAATPEIRAAANKFLQESYDELAKYRPAILYGEDDGGGDDGDGGDDGGGDDGEV